MNIIAALAVGTFYTAGHVLFAIAVRENRRADGGMIFIFGATLLWGFAFYLAALALALHSG